ncbi:MAG: glycosyltransferase family 1 protein [Pseudomonadota bacterium]
MRLIFDLFPSQTTSRFRGIGRYTLSLARAMAAQAGAHEMRLLANGLYPDSVAQFRAEFAGLAAPGAYAAYTHPPLDPRRSGDLRQEKLASALIHTAYQAVGADAILCASPFEGWGERGLVPQAEGGLPGGLRVAVLYDFIPWLFPKQHLDAEPDYKQWYARRLAALGQYDLLLAISEATRNDAIRLLDIAPERVVNISGAADAMFRPLPPQALAATDLRRFGIERPFVLYTGNSDYRKNLSGMLAAFARLPQSVRDTHQLVVNQVGDIDLFRLQVANAGLRHDHVVVTGRIGDDELLALYNGCKVFVFPSLYEGFGLPVLEAMGCGAAVIAGDNSSIPEVAGRADMLFDAASPDAISASLLRALTDDAWRAELRAWSLARAARFSWDRTARAAWEAIDTALHRRQARAAADPGPRLRVAVLPAPPPGAQRERALARVSALAAHADIEPVGEDGGDGTLPREWRRFDTVLYIATPRTLTPELVDLIRSAPGVLLLQQEADAAAPAAPPVNEAALSQLLRDQGLQGLLATQRPGAAGGGTPRPLGRSLLEALRCLVLETGRQAEALRQGWPPAALPALFVLDDDGQADTATHALRLAAALRAGAEKSWRRAPAHIAAAWRGAAPPDAVIDEVARHAERNLRLNRGARILVDVTTAASGAAVDEVVRALCLLEDAATPIELVQLREGSLHRAGAVAAALFGIAPEACPAEQIDIQPGDILLLTEAAPEHVAPLLPVCEAVRQFGGRIACIVRAPQPSVALLRHSDLLLCASGAPGGNVLAEIAGEGRAGALARVASWPPGAATDGPRGSARRALALLHAAFDPQPGR